MNLHLLTSLLVTLTNAAFETQQHWIDNGRADIRRAWASVPNYNLAQNVILMVGDGMGVSTVTAARIYKGQKLGKYGEDYKLAFEDFPHLALSKTYNLDRQVPDSAGTAVAMVTGVKVNMGTLGLTGEVPYQKNCSQVREDRKLKSVLDYALEEGKSVGIVTTTRVTHATPAAAYAHVPHRDWESDADMAGIPGCEQVKDIAYQLIMDNPNINVILGGGRQAFINNSSSGGKRQDGRDLRENWKRHRASSGLRYAYVETKADFDQINPDTADYLLGLFELSHMTYELERNASKEPSLTEMVDKAIRILKKNPKGFFLLIEGGRIDHAHHDNLGKKALEETVEFDNAVRKVTELTSADDTLTVVTADHSHVFTIAGYPRRGHNILGIVDDMPENEMPVDKMPLLTLGYTNGPASKRVNYTEVDTTDNNFKQPGCVQMPWETHGGEDVAIYAQGPMAHLLHGVHEQSYIGHVLMHSACLGEYKNDCDLDKREKMKSGFCGTSRPVSSIIVILGVLFKVVLDMELL
ncbi:unnamed protein product [Candidula unifasciata]|uniref:alkaline phosphatase n=1 Tax=Candidula unifasciata TaxID=100452 RepID=A0A8S3YSL4_9EUPU|nr:unnamed protein product [Candidula unifasciata]